MIKVSIYGGLGNQMFQYAAGFSLAARHRVPLCLDLSWYRTRHIPAVTPRTFELDFFQLGGELIRYLSAPRRAALKLQSKAVKIFPTLRGSYFAEKHFFDFDPDFNSLTCNARLDGYFQAQGYFRSFEDELRMRLRPISFSENLLRAVEVVTAVPHLAIHVRRGDYVSNDAAASFHGFCGGDYFMRAVSLSLRERGIPEGVVAFTDDVEWCRAHLSNLTPANVPLRMAADFNLTAPEEMWLMSRCERSIISNSSFSWWAAWLGATPRSFVVMPSVWAKGLDRFPKELILQNSAFA